MIEVDPLIVACPRCGAQPISTDLPDGERCKTRSGRPDNPHRGRVIAAERAAQQKEPTVPQDSVPTVDAAAAGLTPPPDWNPAAPSATAVGAATSELTLNPPAATHETTPEQDQQDRLPTDPALRRAALRARGATATPDEDTGQQHTERAELDIDRLTDEQVDRLANVIAERIAATAETYTAELISPAVPGRMLGATVWFRSRTGRWTAPAIITATLDSLYQPNVDAGHLPPLTDGAAVHLTVQTPGIQGHVSAETAESNPELVADDRPNKPAGGTFQEWDVQWWDPGKGAEVDPATFTFEQQPAGTWMWPL